MIAREPHPPDASDEGRALVAPCPALLWDDAARRGHPPRGAFDGPRHPVRAGILWRAVPDGLPP